MKPPIPNHLPQTPKSFKFTQAPPGPALPHKIPFGQLLLYIFLVYVFFLAADRFADAGNYNRPSVIIFIFHTIFLFIHEGGHFLFSFFGNTLHILGGSFWQVMFPFLSFLIAIRDRSHVGAFALFLTGFNLMDVSVYMRDAPYRQLPLLGGHKVGHDWYNLFLDWQVMQYSGTIADITYYTGCVLCVGSILAGFYFVYRTSMTPAAPAMMEKEPTSWDDSTDIATPSETGSGTAHSSNENTF